ncbi:MAG: Trk family potassium uptake protein [Paenibacillaceae bacterium]|nr:Trk family potassium uptake protein [Paenibacillaceae bacterium]
MHSILKFRPSPPQVLAFGFVAIIFIGSVLLAQSVSFVDRKGLPYLDALFMATSAVCVTGLSVVNPGAHYSIFGQTVLIILVQIGGLGFMTMATLVALVMKRRISFRERLILQEAMNHDSTSGIIRLIRSALLYALAIELAGAILLTAYLAFELPFGQAVYFGVFHSISIFNNAGFDLFGTFPNRAGSLIPYVTDPFINIVSMVLIILGGIGFIVIAELATYRKSKRISLHAKVVLTFSAVLIVLGALVIFAFEFTNALTLQPLSWHGKLFGALFQSVSARSAGMNTIDPGSMRQATQFFIALLMFIGAAPGSTGGGIKVTTFAILLGAMVTMIRGKEDIVLFRYRIARERVYHAITFTLISFFVVLLASMALSVTESAPFLNILFEATSAFGTTGMSLGLTSHLTSAGKIVLILLMFVGRLGPVTLAIALTRKPEKELYRHPEGHISIG